jgi:hypothetical protein
MAMRSMGCGERAVAVADLRSDRREARTPTSAVAGRPRCLFHQRCHKARQLGGRGEGALARRSIRDLYAGVASTFVMSRTAPL